MSVRICDYHIHEIICLQVIYVYPYVCSIYMIIICMQSYVWQSYVCIHMSVHILPTPKDGSARRPIRLTWVLKIKKCEDSTVDKFRARLCGLGCSQTTSRQGLSRQNCTSIVCRVSSQSFSDGKRARMGSPSAWCILCFPHCLSRTWHKAVSRASGRHEATTRALAPWMQSTLWLGSGRESMGRTQSNDAYTPRLQTQRCGTLHVNQKRYSRYSVILGIIVDDFAITGHPTSVIKTAMHEIMTIWDCTYLGQIRWMLNMRITRQPATGHSDYRSERICRWDPRTVWANERQTNLDSSANN